MESAATIAALTKPSRRLATRFLLGEGIEIGACHLPLPVDPLVCKVRYVDWASAEVIRERFSDLAGYEIVPTDVVCDLAKQNLKPFSEATLDFVIANHVLEHVPNPLALFADVHRTLKPGGVFFLSLPDKRFTFDRERAVTPLEHLIEDFERKIDRVDELHLVDYLTHAAKIDISADKALRAALFQRELARSIHVHVWTWEAVVEWVRYMVVDAGRQFELLDFYLPTNDTHEVLMVLRKTVEKRPPEAVARAFDESLKALLSREIPAATAAAIVAAPPAPLNGAAAGTNGASAHAEPVELPLRYRLADSVVAQMKRVPWVADLVRSAARRL